MFNYSSNKNVQILVSLLKAYGIRYVIASPGTTNLEFVVSMQHDSFFKMYSCVDERSAAYMACGLASETGEPVVITCTEATASRDYFPGLTEAYHRKLPILAVTGLHDYRYVGNLEPQVIDRSVSPVDTFIKKVNLPVIKDEVDYNVSVLKINEALIELGRKNKGPVHINMPWNGGKFDFSLTELPAVKKIDHYYYEDEFPKIEDKKVAVLIGSHIDWTSEQTRLMDEFCSTHDALVVCDHTSKYYGKFRAQCTLITTQKKPGELLKNIDILVHMGEEFGDEITRKALSGVKEVWRVGNDGYLRDTFGKLSKIFEMSEEQFLSKMSQGKEKKEITFYAEYEKQMQHLEERIPELPFSSIFVANRTSKLLPANSVLHLGASDSIRAWNFFRLPEGIKTRANSGCRGIDGCVSSLVGASFASPETLYIGVFGDLTFFYDMNALGNRHIGGNVRIIVVNNDGGNIFRHNGHAAQVWLGYEKTNEFVAAGGHYGKQSKELLKHYSESLGFDYISASDKSEYEEGIKKFLNPSVDGKPILFEIFTQSKDDSDAFDIIGSILQDSMDKNKAVIKNLLGETGTAFVRKHMSKLKKD